MEKKYLNDSGLIHFWDKIKSYTNSVSDALQGQIDDKQQQITANDDDISLLQTRSTQIEETIKSIAATGGASQAIAVTYNNDSSGLNALNAQDAIDEVSSVAIYDVSARNNGAVFESLQALLRSSNLNTLIPTSVRRGGMTIRFIQGSEQSSDNKYVQYRLMANEWSTTVADWQGVDDEPTAGSHNLVKSGSVYTFLSAYEKIIGENSKIETTEFTHKKFIDETGFVHDGAWGYWVDQYDVSSLVGKTAFLKTKINDNVVYAYTIYDENNAILKHAEFDSTLKKDYIVEIPTNSKYLYISNVDYVFILSKGQLFSLIDELRNLIEDNRLDIDSLMSESTQEVTLSGTELSDWKFIGPEGNIIAGAYPWKVVKYDISSLLSGTIDLLSKASENESVYAYSLHDSNSNVLKVAEVNIISQKAFSFNAEDYPTAKYLYITNPDYVKVSQKGTIPSIILAINGIIDSLMSESTQEVTLSGTELSDWKFIGPEGNIIAGAYPWKVVKYDISSLLSGTIDLLSKASENESVYAYSLHDSNSNVLKVAEVNIISQKAFSFNAEDYPTAKYLYITNPDYVKVSQKGTIPSIILAINGIINNLDIITTLQNDIEKQSEIIDEQIKKIFTENNNILWVGTSIPEGATYPKHASAKCGYNCINNSFGGSQLIWDGVRPSYVSEYSGRCLTAKVSELESMFRQDVTAGTITESMLNLWKNKSYERSVIPYIDGTNANQVSMIVIDHGFNDRQNIYDLLQNERNINWDSRDRSNFVGAFNYILDRIREINPTIKIVVAGYFQNKYTDYHSYEICKMQEMIAEHFNLSIMKVWEHSQINDLYIKGTSNYIETYNAEYGTSYQKVNPDSDGNIMALQIYCPDAVHPHSDKTGNCNKRLDAVVSKLLRDLI